MIPAKANAKVKHQAKDTIKPKTKIERKGDRTGRFG
jgi:hypothetical protein